MLLMSAKEIIFYFFRSSEALVIFLAAAENFLKIFLCRLPRLGTS